MGKMGVKSREYYIQKKALKKEAFFLDYVSVIYRAIMNFFVDLSLPTVTFIK